MRADHLHDAVLRVAGILDEAGIRPAVDRFRSSQGDERTAATLRLRQAGALISERFQALDAGERHVVESLHLGLLGKPTYWQGLLEESVTGDAGRAEVVRLAARLMFASQNLPGLTALLEHAGLDESDGAAQRQPQLASGESRLSVRLVDSGERASNPDRIARAIDGVDMVYSACASIGRRSAMDLRLDAIDGTDSRDLHLTGGREAVAAVFAVMASIPEAVRAMDADGNADDVDLDALVSTLPVFHDLDTLASVGSFAPDDLSNISETMRQGALLILESGITLVPDTAADAPSADASDIGGNPSDVDAAVAADRHYEAYLREREAMRGGEPASSQGADAPTTGEPSVAGPIERNSVELAKERLGSTMEQDRAHRIEVDRLLSTLKDQRGQH